MSESTREPKYPWWLQLMALLCFGFLGTAVAALWLDRPMLMLKSMSTGFLLWWLVADFAKRHDKTVGEGK